MCSHWDRRWLWGSTPSFLLLLSPQSLNVIVELHVVVQFRGGVLVALDERGHLCWSEVRGTRETAVELGGEGKGGEGRGGEGRGGEGRGGEGRGGEGRGGEGRGRGRERRREVRKGKKGERDFHI